MVVYLEDVFGMGSKNLFTSCFAKVDDNKLYVAQNYKEAKLCK
jgi:hypothetical protein